MTDANGQLMRVTLAVSLLSLMLAGCEPSPDTARIAKGQTPVKNDGAYSETTYRPNGEIDGCRLYYVSPRYGGSFHLAVCRNQMAVTNWREGCGKSCSREVSVKTEMVE